SLSSTFSSLFTEIVNLPSFTLISSSSFLSPGNSASTTYSFTVSRTSTLNVSQIVSRIFFNASGSKSSIMLNTSFATCFIGFLPLLLNGVNLDIMIHTPLLSKLRHTLLLHSPFRRFQTYYLDNDAPYSISSKKGCTNVRTSSVDSVFIN